MVWSEQNTKLNLIKNRWVTPKPKMKQILSQIVNEKYIPTNQPMSIYLIAKGEAEATTHEKPMAYRYQADNKSE